MQSASIEESNQWHVCVAIPARDEEQLLPRCLSSVLEAKLTLPPNVSVDIVVAVDCSLDHSLTVARRHLKGQGTAIVLNDGSVGQARAAAVSFGLRHYSGPLDRCWVANTDADCVVPKNWLSKQLELAKLGVAGVSGIIDVEDFSEHQHHVMERFKETYLLGPHGRHHHIHGANLGFRADAYIQAGGWPAIPSSEDHALWSEFKRVGANTYSDSSLVVLTSGRKIGRAPDGFAGALSALDTL